MRSMLLPLFMTFSCLRSVAGALTHAELFRLGAQAMQDGRVADAKRHFEAASVADPSHEPTRRLLVRFAALDDDALSDDDSSDLLQRETPIDGGRISIATVAEAGDATGATAGTGLWASAPALVGWLCEDAPLSASDPRSRRELFEGRSVIELGSGTGFVGLSLAQLGASRVLLTDLPQRLPLLRRNRDANGGSLAELAALAWGTSAEEALASHGGFGAWDLVRCHVRAEPEALPLPPCAADRRPRPAGWRALVLTATYTTRADSPVWQVVATDVTYDAQLVPLLATTLGALLARGSAAGRTPAALLALPQRSAFRPPVTRDGRVVPDAEMLFELLRNEPELGARIGATRLDTLPSEPHPIDVFLLEKGH